MGHNGARAHAAGVRPGCAPRATVAHVGAAVATTKRGGRRTTKGAALLPPLLWLSSLWPPSAFVAGAREAAHSKQTDRRPQPRLGEEGAARKRLASHQPCCLSLQRTSSRARCKSGQGRARRGRGQHCRSGRRRLVPVAEGGEPTSVIRRRRSCTIRGRSGRPGCVPPLERPRRQSTTTTRRTTRRAESVVAARIDTATQGPPCRVVRGDGRHWADVREGRLRPVAVHHAGRADLIQIRESWPRSQSEMSSTRWPRRSSSG